MSALSPRPPACWSSPASSSALRGYDTSATLHPPCLSSSPSFSSCPSPNLSAAVSSLAIWDGIHFARPAECGYEYEQSFTFLPLLPASAFLPASIALLARSRRGAVLVLSGYVLNNVAFVASAAYFYRNTVATAPAARVLSPTAVPAEIARDGVLCLEEVDGRRWSYVVDAAGAAVKAKGRASIGAAFKAVLLQSPLPPVEEIMSFIRSYVVPEGFPHSVTPSYVPYMSWTALKHFFGGAMGVFTTRTLLNSVGVSQSKAVPGAVAINWILKVFLTNTALLHIREKNKYQLGSDTCHKKHFFQRC